MSAATGVRRPVNVDLHDAAAFIWHEAELLDRHRYGDWLALWMPAGRYVIPIDRETTDYASALNIVYDDDALRRARVGRLESGLSMSALAAARTVRTVSRFVRGDDDAHGTEIRCAQHVVEQQHDRSRLVAADVTYRLVERDGALAIALKVVRLIDSDEALHGIGYLL